MPLPGEVRPPGASLDAQLPVVAARTVAGLGGIPPEGVPEAVLTGAERVVVVIPLSVHLAIGAGTAAGCPTADASTSTGIPTPGTAGIAVIGEPESSVAAVDPCGLRTGLDHQVGHRLRRRLDHQARHSFRPSRPAADGTTADGPPDGRPQSYCHQRTTTHGLPDGPSLDRTHRFRPRPAGSPPPVTRRPA